MRAFEINFLPAITHKFQWRFSLLAALLGTSGVLIFILMTWKLIHMESTREDFLNEKEILKTALADRDLTRTTEMHALTPEEASAINESIRQLNLPWSNIFNAVEETARPTVALLSIEPDAAHHNLTIGAEGKTLDAMIDYVQALKANALFNHVELSQHEINEKDPYRPVRFELTAHWIDPS